MVKKILIGLLVIFVLLIVSASSFLSYMGVFSKIIINEQQMGPLTFVYIGHKGSYSTIGPDIDAVYKRLSKEFGVKNSKGMGIYYDDPSQVKEENLRSDVGCLLEGSEAKKADAIMKKIRVRIFFEKKFLTATFPIKNNMSYMFGAIKVYPELMKYAQTNGYKMQPCIEIYDIPAKTITFAMEARK